MCTCSNTAYYGQTQKDSFLRTSEHLGVTPLTGKFVETLKKYAIFTVIGWS